MSKSREASHLPQPTKVICPYCGLDNHPALYQDADIAWLTCGYCQKLMKVVVLFGEAKAEKV
jgi:transcription elongation factor Elf1